MRKYLIAYITIMCLALTSCNSKSSDAAIAVTGNTNSCMETCDVILGNVLFNKSQNLYENFAMYQKDTLRIQAGAKTDFFCDPKGKATNTTAPVIHSTIDNTKPFTFTVKVTPQFTIDGTYSAGALFAFVDDNHWQKLCFEQDEDGNHRIVTVRTVETSDDNNHQKIESPSVYLRMSSDTEVIGNYYSEDGENWHLVRIYKNEYPKTIYMSLSAQSPKDNAHTCLFSDVSMISRPVSNFRVGKL